MDSPTGAPFCFGKEDNVKRLTFHTSHHYRMLYPEFKLRYSCLGQAAIASSSDNKVAVWALMDGIPFDREKYRLGM